MFVDDPMDNNVYLNCTKYVPVHRYLDHAKIIREMIDSKEEFQRTCSCSCINHASNAVE